MTTYAEKVKQITLQYNNAIRALQRSYDLELSQQGWLNGISEHSLKRQYSDRYDVLVGEYRRQVQHILKEQERANPAWAKGRIILGRIFLIGIALLVALCYYSLPNEDTGLSTMFSSNSEETTYWNADNIPIPYLQDATQHVSNPDQVLSQPAVDRMNATLKLMEDSLQIQTIVIAVNHIEGDDPFRLAQDVGNRYGVGYNDRGLMIVLGYEDHSINISPGRSLEADLTDAECHRLEQRYVVPAMKAEMPDSGMIYLVEAVRSTLQQKQLPQMSTLTSVSDAIDQELVRTVGIYMMVFIGWCLLFGALNRKYQWIGLLGGVSLLTNPFAESSGGDFYIGGGGFSGGGGGFSGGGGSFGGGSFGGGGATSRW